MHVEHYNIDKANTEENSALQKKWDDWKSYKNNTIANIDEEYSTID